MASAPIIEVNAEFPQPRHIQRAVEVLSSGGVIAYPTDTYYGLGCDLGSKKGIEKLYQLKGRDRKKPLSFLCPDLSDVAKYAHVSNFAYRTMKSLTPGAFTFILEATRLVPEVMMSKQKQVGIRVPDAELARALAAALGRPIVTTSATDAEGEPLIDAKDIKDALGHGLDLILDGGVRLMEPSTVVSLIGDQIEVLRQGKGQLD
ncbi:L-threonylcarbamoyladenylate synthase [Archangium violaceum]|uniref:L-threonylcarbamoyladenylate synthase n=1 Tax=Archangium TaxID=47 RepID=UPI000936A67A|nr:L-threonylcarbamoyladenylate synthase [Archangium sp. Cb G35]OJT16316.1 threonylcarbamoyl-AMP synthase [Archangium sp. Cb G35]WPB82102.1 L-threonylcarbamoyladenylate synthase [Archangium gephyra]